eukprot:11995693-Alexandrium_andersonii.AAC.1
MPTKKVAPTASDAPSTQTLLSPPSPNAERAAAPLTSGPPDVREKILDAVVARVLSTLNVDGLAQELTTKLAEEMLGRVRVDSLVASILEGQMETLTQRLTERLIAQILLEQ